MKKKIIIGVSVVVGAFALFVIYTALFPKSPKKTVELTADGTTVIKVVFGQPSKRGRVIFGEEKDGALQPYGKYWRLGANAATEITFAKNITFGGKPVNAGTYRLYTVPGPTSFEVSLNSETGVFFGVSEPNYALDVVKVDASVTVAPETEKLMVSFTPDSTSINMNWVWDKTQFTVPIKIQ